MDESSDCITGKQEIKTNVFSDQVPEYRHLSLYLRTWISNLLFKWAFTALAMPMLAAGALHL